MKNYLNKIDNLQKELESLSPLKSEDQKRLDKKFRLEFNYNSNHIEGNTLTYGETELLLFFDNTKGDHTLREFEEMKAHDIAYLKISEWAKEERPISETDIKELNRIILVRNFWKEAITSDNQPTRREIKVGNYKEFPNSVRLENGEMFDYASPTETPIKMQEMMDWYKKEGKDFHPVVLAAMFHYKFVRIHPFDDGNGRVARLLLNYILLKNNFPPIVIKSSDKKNYLSALHKADVGDLEAFSKYIAEQLIWSLEISIKAGKGKSIDEANDWEKKLVMMKTEIFKGENKKVVLRYNDLDFAIIWNENILPFIEKIDFIISEIEPLFDNSQFSMRVNNDFREIKGKFSSAYSGILTMSKNPYTIEFDCSLEGYTNDSNIAIHMKSIGFKFNNNKYILKIDNFEFSKFYDEKMTDEEIEMIKNNIGQDMMFQIENHDK